MAGTFRLSSIAFAQLLAVLAFSSCGGGTNADHAPSKKAGPLYVVHSDVVEAGLPCVIRCWVELDPSIVDDPSRQVDQWEWVTHGGAVIVLDGEYPGETRIAFAQSGSCNISARGVDKDGRDCTTPRHKLTAHKRFNAPPVIVVDEALNVQRGMLPNADGTATPYSQATWSCARCYDPDGDDPFTGFDWRMSSDTMSGQPVFEAASLLHGEPRNADLDGDGRDDIVIVPTAGSQTEFTVRFVFHTMEVDDHAMYDLHLDAGSASGYRKGWDGCIYGNGTPSKGLKGK